MKIQTRIIGAVMLVVAVVTIVFSVYLFNKERTAARAELAATIKNNETLLKVVTAGPLYDGNVEQLDAILNSLFTNPDLVQIELTEFNGNIRLHRTKTPAMTLGETITNHIVISRSIDDLGEINITYSTALLEERLLKSRNQIVLFSFVLVLGLSGVIFLVARGLTGPIERLTIAARDMANGHLDREINARGAEELQSLGQSFIRMRDAIRGKMTDLEAQNEALRLKDQAIASSINGIAIASPEGSITYVNAAFLRLWGYDQASDVMGRSVVDFWADRDRAAHALGSVLSGGGSYGELTARRRDGSEFVVEFSASAVKNATGATTHLMGSFVNVTERKIAAEALQESESRLRQAVRASQIGIFNHNHLTDTIYWSPEQRQNYGWGPDEPVVLAKFIDQVHPEDRERIVAAVQRAHDPAGDGLYDVEHRIIRRDGEVRWLITRSQTYFEGDGDARHPVRTVGGVIDITERKRVVAALQESRNLLQTIFDTIPARVFWKDRELRYLGCNRPFALDAGAHSPEELMGKDDYQMGWREQAELYRSDDRKVLETGTPKINYEEPQTTPDGRRIWLRTNKVPLKNADGTIWGVLGTYEDITEYKKTEASLREAALIVENSPVMLFRWKAAEGWPIVLVSQNVVQLGYTPEELLKESMRFVSMVHPDDLERITHEVQTYTDSGIERFHQEYRILTKDRQVRWIDDRTMVERDDTGRVTHYQGIVVDITDQKLAEKEREKLQSQLNHAQRMESIGRLAGGVAHDFNNMLSVILGYATLMKGKLSGTDPLMQYLQEIEHAAVRSRDLTSQLLAFSRKQVVTPKVVNLIRLIEGLQKSLTRMIGEDVELRVISAEDLGNIKIDPMQVDQIIMNLAVNARDAMPNGGSLTIETSNVQIDEAYCRQHAGFRPGSFVLLTVSDNGSGMSKETLSHIFEPFFTTKEFGKGTGLGLATVYGIVKQNDGFINVYSEVGQGTTFKIYLPRVADGPAVAGAPSPAAAAVPAGAGTILLVEDDAMVRELTLLLLQTLGYSVIAANSSAHALSLCERKDLPIDLLMTDVVMPGMNGKELLQKANAIRPGIRVLFMSGYTANVIAHHGVLDESIKFIQKPFSIDDLAQKVQDAIRDRA